ncbi:MAG TPA: hypothetical protein PLS03_16405 [Terrimicrobiaceae bacterium]|nr:hypothetical protein [Terrimicrobiaceae bacterium]
MKKLLLMLVCVGFASASAFAGSCGGCNGGDKSKDDKSKDTTKQSFSVRL